MRSLFRKNAKKYYFDVLEPELGAYRTANKKLTYSNEIITEQIISELSAENSHWIKKFFNSVFVAKSGNNDVSAYALSNNKEFSGFLSVYDVGLTIASEAWSNCFLHLVLEILPNVDGNDEEIYLNNETVRLYIDSFTDIFSVWAYSDKVEVLMILEFYEKYGVQYPNDLAANYSVNIDKFIVAHELGHHLSGDVDSKYVYTDALEKVTSRQRRVPLAFGSETDEHIADVVSYYLMVGGPESQFWQKDDSIYVENILEATYGTLGCLSMLMLFSEEPYKRYYPSYPSANQRFNNAFNKISVDMTAVLTNGHHSEESKRKLSFAFQVKRDIFKFNELLNESRLKRGLVLPISS